MDSPTPEQVREARQAAELTQAAAAALLYKPARSWQNWERPIESPEHRTMDPALFELFLIKSGQMPWP